MLGLGAAIASAVLVSAQESTLHWIAAADGSIPESAIETGHGGGRAVYICRGTLRGTQIGKIAVGLGGCSVASDGRAVVLKFYEVLAHPPRRGIDGRITVMRDRPSVEVARPPRTPSVAGVVVPTAPDSLTKRGFDDRGQPYVEVRLPDGTIKRTGEEGVTLFKPDGTTEFIPKRVMRMNAQPPTPPSLPSDPAQGRVWVERHNESLLDVISNLVQRDQAEMTKFAAGERQAAGDDLFRQIAYRTSVADFLASER
jgi:hypothetical protein